MESRFSRTALLLGEESLHKLAAAQVAIFGLGGVGSYAAEALCRAGVGKFLLVDDDVVQMSNINRQLYALEETLGQAKVEVAAQRMRSINPRVEVEACCKRYGVGQGPDFIKIGLDYVLDAIDDVEAKVDLLYFCVTQHIPVAASMGAGNKLDPTAFQIDDISKTTVCPLARVVRRRLRQRGVMKGIPVVYSTEQPCTTGEMIGKGRIPGSISFVPSVAGLILAGFVVKDLLKQ